MTCPISPAPIKASNKKSYIKLTLCPEVRLSPRTQAIRVITATTAVTLIIKGFSDFFGGSGSFSLEADPRVGYDYAFYQSPKKDCHNESAETAAVSALKILGPKVTGIL